MLINFFFQVSVSCGIPDFRSRDGVYARLAVDFPDLPNPEVCMLTNALVKKKKMYLCI